MIRALFVASFAAVACAGAQPAPAPAPADLPPADAQQSPALVVVLTIDQLRPDYLTRWRSQFTG